MKTEFLEIEPETKLARRSFLKYAGSSVAAITILGAVTSCHRGTNDPTPTVAGSVDIGSGDPGILNYAYALEQLEAAFYIQVAAHPYSGITSLETAYLTDIRDHEVAHREFFKAALGGSAIKALTPDFSSINFSDRTSVLGAAKAFEDTGVSAYNGAGYLIKNPTYLTLAGKIVSVEARHAALIRNLIAMGSFADQTAVDSNGLDGAKTIAEVLPIANTYLKTKITATHF